MKNFSNLFIPIFLIMLMSNTVFATAENDSNEVSSNLETSTTESIKEKISSALIYPSSAVEENLEGDVWVKVDVDNNGNLKVMESNSQFKTLENYTRKKIESLKIQGVQTDVELYLQVSFKIL